MPGDVSNYTIKITIYVDEASKVPYNIEGDEDPSNHSRDITEMVKSVIFTTRSLSEGDDNLHMNENNLLEHTNMNTNADDGIMFDENGQLIMSSDDEAAGADELKFDPENSQEIDALETIDVDGANRGNMLQNDSNLSMRVVTNVKIALDIEECEHLRSEGYEVSVVEIDDEGVVKTTKSYDMEETTETDNANFEENISEYFKFYICTLHGMKPPMKGKKSNTNEENEFVGVEDILFIKSEKALGQIPTLPMYNVFYENDISHYDDAYAVYLAVRIGPNPFYSR